MWVFYLISLPLTVGMVIFTLKYFAGPEVPRYVLLTVGYTWFCSLSVIILVPADIWTTMHHSQNGGISFFWSWSYWSTFLLTWAVVPLIQGFEDAGDFTVKERLKTSLHVNFVFYLVVGSIGLFGLILIIMMHKNWSGGILGLAMACSNTFGLVTGAFLLGFGLGEIPKSIWRNANWTTRQKVLSHKIAKMAVKLDDAHQELSNVIVVAQATSNQMSKRDPLRPYMNVIDNMLAQMFTQDPSFKPQGGRLGENDMDYDTDEKSMATLRRHLRRAREEYYRYKSEYMTYVMEALELEDTVKNYERRTSTGWKYISSLRPAKAGKIGPLIDTIEFCWRCILRKQLKKLLAILLGIMSAAILLAEATLLTSDVDLSLFSFLINSVRKQEVLVQVLAFIPLMYMCMCTYYSLFKVGMFMFYSLTPRQTSSVNLLMICSSWKMFRFQTEADDMDGFDPSGLIILQKERSWIEQGEKAGEHVIPLARNFNSTDIESSSNRTDKTAVEMKVTASLIDGGIRESPSRSSKEETRRYSSSKEAISNKYAGIREQSRQKASSNMEPAGKNIALAKVSLLDSGNSSSVNTTGGPSSGLASTWESMKTGFQSFKANVGAKKFLPLRQIQETKLVSRVSSSESLDEIFQRLKRPSANHKSYSDEDEDGIEIDSSGPNR
ncbi:LMBR1 domain-containing protein 2 homolog A isoform X2 [Juglans microcarpa x Juglans regia]|uniref:LMBR1 domain-containing protein 2 homolog A isoform X2 n=1 Tax=Juglans microcarpa x Juglans regia TaxID=2249226 RepID=UPI001B7F72D5|nr:LMBR1 domain-containing protein 2 homolog A isoform X2 [Juglans microcarpa x Juglans regia]